MSAADNLRRARAVIATPATWTQGALARDRNGAVADVHGQRAESFCAIGALCREGVRPCDVERDLLQQALPDGADDLEQFNDVHEHADVLALYDCAIALAEAP